MPTTYPQPTGVVRAVPPGGSLQAALDAAQPGDVITLAPGAVYTGPFTLPAKPGAEWIIIRSAAPDASLPPPGVRISPAYAAVLPKIVSLDEGPAVRTAPGAHHFRFVAVEFTVGSQPLNYGLVAFGDGSSAQSSLASVAHDLVLDRVYIHGNPATNLRRGVALNSAWSAVVDSYIADVHEIGADSQAICGWNGPGPYKIANNSLQAAGENVMFGGADPFIPNLVPEDIEVTGNHMAKPLSWRIDDPSYAGKPWQVKNLFELKNARRVLVEGNVLENNWLHAQNGFAILFTVRNQDGAAPWSVVEDVTFRRNVLRHTGSAINILGNDDIYPSQRTRRILIRDNLFDDVSGARWGGSGRLLQVLRGAVDVVFDHNTAFHSGEVVFAEGEANAGFVYRNNLAANNAYGVAGTGTTGNPSLTLQTYFPGAVVARNAFMGGDASKYPLDNFFPATWLDVKLVDAGNGDPRLDGASPYKHKATDGGDVGVDMDALWGVTLAVVQDALAIDDVVVVEGDSGSRSATFTVTRPPSLVAASVQFATSDALSGAAPASAGSDYAPASGTLTFAPGQTSRTLTVAVLGDALDEADESFAILLSQPVGATLARQRGTATIADDDVAGLSVSDAAAREGVSDAHFQVKVSPPPAAPVTVDYTTVAGSAAAGVDYTPVSGTLTFAANESSKTLQVAVRRDVEVEGPETFTLKLANPSGAVIGRAEGLGTISDGTLAAGDLGGDGKSDILWRKTSAGSDKGAAFLWEMNGTGLAGARYLDPISEDWQVQFTGDFNGDGNADILWRNLKATASDAGKLFIWMMDGTSATSGTGYTAAQADLTWRVDGVGDLNGDGRSDIVWRKTGPGPDRGAVFLWTMDGTGVTGARALNPISEDWQVVDLGDFNGDGKADILWRNFNPASTDAGKLYVWMMDGGNVLAAGYTASQADLGWRVDGVGDLSGDGRDDIVWRKVGAGVDQGAVFLWTMSGAHTTDARYLEPISEAWQVEGLGDFNGDGKADILWRNYGPPGGDAGKLYLWMMDGGTVIAGGGYTAAQADLGWRVDSPRK